MPAVLSVALFGATTAGAQTPATTPTSTTPVATTPVAAVPAGVSVAGIDLSGLSAVDAAAKLQAAATTLTRPISVQVATHKYKLSAGQSGYSVDYAATAAAALAAKKAGAVAPVVKFDTDNVRAFVKKLATTEYRAPKDARISITVAKIRVAPHVVGRRIEVNPLTAQITKALQDPTLPRYFQPKRAAVSAAVTKGTLKKTYSTILTADRGTHKLRLFKGLKLSKTYSIAVGMAGHDTPAGLYKITNKAVNPAWHVPNSAWAGSLAGTTVPGGAANNPLKARWLGIADGVGIHGTSDDNSIGSNASHGCLRMHVKDVIDLYPRVPVGTTILIK